MSTEWLIKTYQGVDKIIVPSEHARNGLVKTAYEIKNTRNNTQTKISCNCPVEVVPYPVKEIKDCQLNIDFKTNFKIMRG